MRCHGGMKKAMLGLGLLALLAVPARADDTALNDGGYGPEPIGGVKGPESVIRMDREDLTLHLGRHAFSVTARFVFRNTAKRLVKQLVGFPDLGAAEAEARRRFKGDRPAAYDGGLTGPLLGMQTFVDGKPATSQLRYGFVRLNESGGWTPATPQNGGLMAWHALPLGFPPGKPVALERRYHAANGGNVLGQQIMDYVVATGGSWQGTIGQLVADVTLDDGLTVKDLCWSAKEAPYGRVSTPARDQWQVLSATRLKLVWNDFEPRTDKRYSHLELDTLPERTGDGKPTGYHNR